MLPGWAALALAAVFLAQFVLRAEDSLTRESPVWDETMHMDYGLNFTRLGPSIPARDHPYPLPALLTLPLVLTEAVPDQVTEVRTHPVTGATVELRAVEHPRNLWPTRRMNVALATLGLALAGLWIGRRWGAGTGLGFVALGSLDPAWMASARYLTTDIAQGLAFLLGSLALVRLHQTRRYVPLLVAGLACGLGLCAKASGLVLVPGAFVMGLLSRDDGLANGWSNRLMRACLWSAAVAGIGVASYGSLFFVHAALGQIPWSSGVEHLVNAASTFAVIRSEEHGTYLLGTFFPDGTRLYFPALFLAKTPLALLAMIVLPALTATGRAWVWSHRVLFVVPGVFLLVAVISDINLGYRHLTPVFPAFWILGTAGLAGLVRTVRSGRLTGTALIAIFALEVGLAHPHYLQYTNVAFGGVENAWKITVDAASDWGQDLPLLRAWLNTHPPRSGPVHLAYFGTADPTVLGIPHVWRPCRPLGRPRPPAFPAAPCDAPAEVLAVSATCLQGAAGGTTRDNCYAHLRDRVPDAVLGGTILVFNNVGSESPTR